MLSIGRRTEVFKVIESANANPSRCCKAGDVVGLFVDKTITPPTTKIHNDVAVEDKISLVSLNKHGNDLV